MIFMTIGLNLAITYWFFYNCGETGIVIARGFVIRIFDLESFIY